MKEITTDKIIETVAKLCQEANFYLCEDVLASIKKAKENEVSEAAIEVLSLIQENAKIAAEEKIPLCQDCGAAVVFIDLGQDVHIATFTKPLPRGCVMVMKRGICANQWLINLFLPE